MNDKLNKFTSGTINLGEMASKMGSAVDTLNSLGYTYEGGQLWKPPVGDKPDYIKWEKGELQGDPPIGTKFEYDLYDRSGPNWIEVVCISKTKKYCILQYKDEEFVINNTDLRFNYRRIKTP